MALAFSAVQTMTVTNLHSNTSSVTAAWASAVVTNSTPYVDALVQVVLDYANTSPANDKATYVYAYGGIEAGVYSNPIAGTEGDVTLTAIDSTSQNLRLIGVMPYNTADEVVESSPFSVGLAFGILPPYWGIVIVDYTGAALAATGNTVKWVGVSL